MNMLKITEYNKNASNQSSRHSLIDKTSNKDDRPNGMFVFNLKDTVKQYVHIKCKNFTQQISNIYITCAGKVAKVYTDKGSIVLKTVDIYKNQNWLVFGIKYNDDVLNHECAMKYYQSRATFKFTFNKVNFPPKLEKLALLYMGKVPSRDITTNGERVIQNIEQFVELHPVNADGKLKKSNHQKTQNLTLEPHEACEAYDTIIELVEKDETAIIEYDLSGSAMLDKTDNTTIILEGKFLFYDDEFFKKVLKKPSPECNNIAVVLEIGSFYDENMKNYCIPLVLRIPRLRLLPVKCLQDLKISNLYLQSESVADKILFNTETINIGPIPVDKSGVNINYKNVFFIDAHNTTKIAKAAEFFLTKLFVLKLVCDPIVKKLDSPTLFGQRIIDTIIGSQAQFTKHRKYTQVLDSYHGGHPNVIRLTTDTSHATIIGCAAFDLSSLVHHDQHINTIKTFTTTHQQDKSLKEYVFEEHILRTSGVYIELHVNLGRKMNTGLDWNRGSFLQHYMNRAVIVCRRTGFLELLKFYKELIEHNAKSIPPAKRNESEISDSKNHWMFSGYIIDCVEYVIMFVESNHNSLRNTLGRHFTYYEPSILLYDRMMIFEKKLYDKFHEFGGFYQVSMGKPLNVFLNKFGFYLEGNVPPPAWKGMLKLDLTQKCKSMREFCDSQLAIDPEELRSLDIEFGLPMQYINK